VWEIGKKWFLEEGRKDVLPTLLGFYYIHESSIILLILYMEVINLKRYTDLSSFLRLLIVSNDTEL